MNDLILAYTSNTLESEVYTIKFNNSDNLENSYSGTLYAK